MITRYTFLRGQWVKDKSGGWCQHADHMHEVARAIEHSEVANKRLAAEVDRRHGALEKQQELQDEMDRMREPCVWTMRPRNSRWGGTGCGMRFKKETDFKYCPYCGRRIQSEGER